MQKIERGSKVIILAGGRGSRMGELTKEQQKCTLPINGEPLLSLIINELESTLGLLQLFIGVSYREDDVKEVIKKMGKAATFVPHKNGSESGAAYSTFKPFLRSNEPVLGCPGDVLIPAQCYANTYQMKSNSNKKLVITASTNTDEVGTHALMSTKDMMTIDTFIHPVPKNHPTKGYLRDTGVVGINLHFLHHIKELSPNLYGVPILSLIQKISDNNGAMINVIGPRWIHVGYPEDLRKSWKN